MMRKNILGIFILFCLEAFFATCIYACDGCGPSSGCNYIGVMPNFRKNFIGIKYNDRVFVTAPYFISGDEMSLRTTDRYVSAELVGRYFITPRIQFMALLPLAYHTRKEGPALSTIQGLGDAVVLGSYTIYSTPDSSTSYWSHFLQAGAGVKLPTGAYNESNNNHIYHANFQLGSGSLDYIATASYTIRYKKFGFRNDAAYKYNTKNASDYKFGNKFSNNSSFFYWGAFDGDNAIVPQVGLYQEFAKKDADKGFYEHNSGGTTRMLSLGTDIYYSRIAFGLNYMLPVQQPNYDYPTSMKHSMRINLNYFF